MEDKEKFYSEFYSQTSTKGATGLLHKIAHSQLEKNLFNEKYSKILEVGANQEEHLPFIKSTFNKYIMTDISYPKMEQKIENRENVIKVYSDVQALDFEPASFDRVIVSCVLHHVANPFLALKEIRRVCANNGTVSIHLSADPSLLYRILWHIGSFAKLKKQDSEMDFKLNHALEHTGNCFSIETMINAVFSGDKIRKKRFPFPITWNLNLHTTYQIKISK
jgi:phosphatidylethanolamine/phosphatidyl-N-methylethanolamine N-methyltransferase